MFTMSQPTLTVSCNNNFITSINHIKPIFWNLQVNFIKLLFLNGAQDPEIGESQSLSIKNVAVLNYPSKYEERHLTLSSPNMYI